MECIELNWLCKRMKKVKSSQASLSLNYRAEPGKTQFFPAIIVKRSLAMTVNRIISVVLDRVLVKFMIKLQMSFL